MPTQKKMPVGLSAARSSSDTNSAYQVYLGSLAVSGRSSIKTLLNHCCLLLGGDASAEKYEWHKLSFEKVHAVRSALVEMNYSVSTINMTMAALRGVTKAAFNLGLVNGDNMLRINAIKPLKGGVVRVGRRLTKADIRIMINACKVTKSPTKMARDKALLLIGVGAGFRCSEICSLDLDDFDLAEQCLAVKEGKGRKRRHVYLASSVVKALNAWINERGKSPGPLFSRIRKSGVLTDQRLTASGLSYALKNLQVQAGIEPFSPHDLRRTFITRLLEEGVDLNTVRQLAGHSDLSTTVRYDKRGEEWQKKATQNLSV